MQLAQEIGSSAGVAALTRLYGVTTDAASFAAQHVETLKSLDSALANRCGLVLEASIDGFGVGREIALVVIGIGQAFRKSAYTSRCKPCSSGSSSNDLRSDRSDTLWLECHV
jgi:hypothetical protein